MAPCSYVVGLIYDCGANGIHWIWFIIPHRFSLLASYFALLSALEPAATHCEVLCSWSVVLAAILFFLLLGA